MKKQNEKWSGKFGEMFTDRNLFDRVNDDYLKKYGKTRVDINNEIIGNLDRDIRILEVGCGIGNQLMYLYGAGFKNLYGIDLSKYAVDSSYNFNIIQGNVLDIPFKDDFFDMVFTSGLLIHINPSDIVFSMSEIYRCTKKYIWGLEYYSDELTCLTYRNEKDLMWKTNYAHLYLDVFPDLQLVKEIKIPYLDNDNIDTIFLLEKV